jgi:hypothetical protein
LKHRIFERSTSLDFTHRAIEADTLDTALAEILVDPKRALNNGS